MDGADGSSAGLGAQAGRVRLGSPAQAEPARTRPRMLPRLRLQKAAPMAKTKRPSQMLVLLKQSLRLRSVSV